MEKKEVRTASAGTLDSNEVRLTVEDNRGAFQRVDSRDTASPHMRPTSRVSRMRSRTLMETDVSGGSGMRLFIAQQHGREHEHALSEMHRRLFFKSYVSNMSELDHLNEKEKILDDEQKESVQREPLSEDVSSCIEQLRELFLSGCVLFDLRQYETAEIADELLKGVLKVGAITMPQKIEASETISRYDEHFTEAMNHSYNIIFGSVTGLSKPVLAFARLKSAVNFDARDGSLTKFVFLVLCDDDEEAHKAMVPLADSINLIMEDEDFHSEAWIAENRGALISALDHFRDTLMKEEEEKKEVKVEGPLTWTRKIGGGLILDLERRLPVFVSDWVDGLCKKCFPVVIALFFAVFTPAVAFGGLLDKVTDSSIGVAEVILATAVCGIIFAVFSGQPLTILGPTGPMLIFTQVLFQWSERLDVPFLPLYSWTGIWISIILILCAVLDASALIQYATRFTDEIFAALISLFFIYEALHDIIGSFGEDERDVAFLGLILAFGTYWMTTSMKNMRQGLFLRHFAREFLADFGTVISLSAMTAMSYVFDDVDLHKLEVPDSFGTTSGRAWFVPLSDLSAGWVFASAFPALLASLLLFLDQNITARIVNRADHRLRKGAGYHMDMLVLGVLIGICSVFGLPWLVAATVPTLNHIHSLATNEDKIDAYGNAKSHILNVKETRLSALLAHVLVAFSMLILPALGVIPMSVLFGLFLFMGVTSLQGNQFFERLKLWIMDPALYPQTTIVRHVPVKTMHKFTMIQLICLGVLWGVKSTIMAIFFPLFIIMLIPLRMFITKFISPEFLVILDWEEEGDPVPIA